MLGLPGFSFILFPMACANRSFQISSPMSFPTPTATETCYSPTDQMVVSVPPQNTNYPQRYVLRTVSDWDAYCAAVGVNTVPPPPVDFNAKMILAFTYLETISGCGSGNSSNASLTLICQGPGTITAQETDTAYIGPMNLSDPIPGTPLPAPVSVATGYAIAIQNSNLPVEFVIWPNCVGPYCGNTYILPSPTPTPVPTVVIVP